MSFLETLVGTLNRQPSNTVGAFQGFDVLNEIDKHQSLRHQRHLNMQPLVTEATEYWCAQLAGLADRHAAAISNTMQESMTLDEDILQSKLKEQKRKIRIAHSLLLQHSDTRWSETVTDEALQNLQHYPHAFRKAAKV